MIETMPLERAREAYARMMTSGRRFRIVLRSTRSEECQIALNLDPFRIQYRPLWGTGVGLPT